MSVIAVIVIVLVVVVMAYFAVAQIFIVLAGLGVLDLFSDVRKGRRARLMEQRFDVARRDAEDKANALGHRLSEWDVQAVTCGDPRYTGEFGQARRAVAKGNCHCQVCSLEIFASDRGSWGDALVDLCVQPPDPAELLDKAKLSAEDKAQSLGHILYAWSTKERLLTSPLIARTRCIACGHDVQLSIQSDAATTVGKAVIEQCETDSGNYRRNTGRELRLAQEKARSLGHVLPFWAQDYVSSQWCSRCRSCGREARVSRKWGQDVYGHYETSGDALGERCDLAKLLHRRRGEGDTTPRTPPPRCRICGKMPMTGKPLCYPCRDDELKRKSSDPREIEAFARHYGKNLLLSEDLPNDPSSSPGH